MKSKKLTHGPQFYTVYGRGRFPLDMLRYDSACPLREEDSRRIEDNGLRTIALVRYTPDPGRNEPAQARWSSFGWAVDHLADDRGDAIRRATGFDLTKGKYCVGDRLRIRRDGHEQNVVISGSSYINDAGVMQFVLRDPEKNWDVCRGSEAELDAVVLSINGKEVRS